MFIKVHTVLKSRYQKKHKRHSDKAEDEASNASSSNSVDKAAKKICKTDNNICCKTKGILFLCLNN